MTICFLGFPTMQNHYAVPMWSQIIDAERPSDIIELGTWEGGFTCLLGIAARNYGARLHSFGREAINPRSVPWFNHLAGTLTWHQCDVFAEATRTILEGIFAGAKRVVALCDNGCKPKEFKLLAPMLRPGDIIAAHDIGSATWHCQEFSLEDVMPTCEAYQLEPYMPVEADLAGWLIKRKSTTPHLT